jgi:hypothetical protein
MAAEKRQHEEWDAFMVSPAGAAKMADCELLEKFAIGANHKNTNHKGHEETRSSCDLADKPS